MPHDSAVIITGGASGIGAATAEHLASLGYNVIIGYYPKDPHSPEPLIERITAAGGQAVSLPVDVSQSSSVDAFLTAAMPHLKQINHLVSNAGILRRASLDQMSDEQWDEVLHTDLFASFYCTRALLPFLTKGSSIVGVSSISGGIYGWADHAHYATAKAGIVGFIRATAVELAAQGIRANTLIPGIIRTPQSLDEKNSLGEAGIAEAAKGIPLLRAGEAHEMASVIEFLLSDKSSYITGQTIIADGGLSILQQG